MLAIAAERDLASFFELFGASQTQFRLYKRQIAFRSLEICLDSTGQNDSRKYATGRAPCCPQHAAMVPVAGSLADEMHCINDFLHGPHRYPGFVVLPVVGRSANASST